MKNSKLSAIKLRATLSTIIVLVIIGAGIGFYYTQEWLSQQASEVHAIVQTSTAGDDDTQSLTDLQKSIDKRQPAVAIANSMLAGSNNLTEQVINDLDKHANAAGVKIVDYDFSTNDPSAKKAPVNTTFSGAKTMPVTVTIGNPVGFVSYIRFLKAIETNLPKMQVAGINLTSSGSSGSITTTPIKIDVYTR